VGGELWLQAWEKALADMRQRLDKQDLPPAKAAQKYKRFEALLHSWLGGQRFAPEDGVPATSVKKICSEVASWAAKKNSFSDPSRDQKQHRVHGPKDDPKEPIDSSGQKDPLLFTAQAQAMELEQAITASGLERISRPQLNRMLNEVLQFGGASPDSGAEAAFWNCVDSPGQIHDTAGTIVWWGFVDTAASHGAHTWTRPERKALREAGVFLEDGSQERIRQARLWRRPVIHASQRLVLVMPTSQAAQATNPHPLWDEISQAVLREPGAARRITVHAGELRRCCELTLANRRIQRQAVTALELPEANPEWRIPVDRAAFRATESASSLEKLLGCPLAWVFTYLARIRMGALLALQDKSRLAGILAHAVIERIFQETTDWEPDLARHRAREIYARLLPEMGAELLQPGRDVERHTNAEIIGDAVAALVHLLREARLRVVATEQEHQRPHSELGTHIQGVLDLVLRDARDNPVVLDMKWTRTARYRRAEIQEGRSVQLATYSWLLSEPDAQTPVGTQMSPGPQLPVAAYFMLVQGRLLTADASCFPGQSAISGPGLDHVWENVVTQSSQAMDALKLGLAAAPGADPQSEAKTAPCGFCDYGNLCGASREES
jgi:ATP-dependent helicase/nuclease subunit B